MAGDGEYEERMEDLIARWEKCTAELREVADRVRWKATRLADCDAVGMKRELPAAVEELASIMDEAGRGNFESLIFLTTQLHRRGTEVLNPDYGPAPKASPFLRTMPADQDKVEAGRTGRQARHVEAYELHIRQSLEHFVQAWTALVDGALIADWVMIDDEFPKLQALAGEVDRAFRIWEATTK